MVTPRCRTLHQIVPSPSYLMCDPVYSAIKHFCLTQFCNCQEEETPIWCQSPVNQSACCAFLFKFHIFAIYGKFATFSVIYKRLKPWLIFKISKCSQFSTHIRGKEKLEQLPCEKFLHAFEIYRALLRAKQVGEKRGKI